MREYGAIGAVIAILVLLVVGLSGTFTVGQTEQAIVLRFGEPVGGRGLVRDPGLHFKIPLIETVVTLPNLILDLEAPNQEILASDNTRLQVDAFLRYRITDPLRFYQTVQTVDHANNQIGYILNSAIRRVLGEANLTQIVSGERAALMGRISGQVNTETERLGIAAVDVRIRRADLPEQISEQVYKRMNSERQREAAEYRAQGAETAQKIRAKADRDVVVLLGQAQQQADQARGEGDAMRNKIFADAYGKDPDFFAFYRSMSAYDAAFKGADTRFVTSPTGDFFRYFKSPSGKPPAAPSDSGKPADGLGQTSAAK